MNRRIQVAVGILQKSDGQVLVGQRTVADAYFEKWEFPGGKLEAGESPEVALQRELDEELGIVIIRSESLMTIEHDYPDRKVQLYVRQVTEYSGEPQGNEGQAIKWVTLSELETLDFLQGNQVIVDALTGSDDKI